MGALLPNMQGPRERAQLRAVWEAHPKVADLQENVEAFAWKHNLKFDVAGMSAALKFASEHIRANGGLPETGIIVA